MKKFFIILSLIFLIGCLTTNQVYLPYTSPIFHKKDCVALRNNPSSIKYPSVQSAINSGVTACSICIKTNQYTSSSSYKTNYSQYPSYYSSQPTSNQNIWATPFGGSVSGAVPAQPTLMPSYGSDYSDLDSSYDYNQTSILNRTPLSSGIIPTTPTLNNRGVAENSSYYGEISEATGRPKTVYVNGYYRKDGTYVRSHYRSPPRNSMTQSLYKKYSNPPDTFDYNANLPPRRNYNRDLVEFPKIGTGILNYGN